MSRVVLDASAIMAAIANEPGSDVVYAHMRDAAVSTVNLAEVETKLIARGYPAEDAWESATSFSQEIVAFDRQQAKTAGGLVQFTQPFGLSLGDRACLALALILGAPVYTTDRIWTKLSLPVEVRPLR